jgi:hypothetical protein
MIFLTLLSVALVCAAAACTVIGVIGLIKESIHNKDTFK